MLIGSFPNLEALYGIVCSKLSKTEQETELDFLRVENVLIHHKYAFFLALSSRREAVLKVNSYGFLLFFFFCLFTCFVGEKGK